MHMPSANELLQVWEWGHALSATERGLLLLMAAFPEIEEDVLAHWSIGQRDASLLELREKAFGSRIQSVVTCPSCTERLEFELTVGEIRVPLYHEASHFEVRCGEYGVRARLPNSDDLRHLKRGTSMEALVSQLIERCTVQALCQDQNIDSSELPTEVRDQMTAAMAERDGQANIHFYLACTACRYEWLTTFDIVSFFWREIHGWAVRVLNEVHALASAYGWSETDILAMAPIRRQLYLEMQGA
jgi:hypothetical protein